MPVALTVPLVFVVGSWVDMRLNPPCDVQKRGLVMRTDTGRWTLEEEQPGNSQPPCRVGPDEPERKGTYVPE